MGVLTNKFTSLSNAVVLLKAASSVERVEWDGKTFRVNNQAVKVADYQQLRNLCAAINRSVLIAKHGNGSQILFYFSTIGIPVSGSAKGIAYQEHAPHILVKDTDREHLAHAPFTVCREVYPNWYLFYSQ